MTTTAPLNRGADEVIQECLDLDNPKSFFLYAGAGSGKTYSLVEAVRSCKSRFNEKLFVEGRKIAIITYTNAAAEEVIRRLEYDPLVEVSTIHAFSWLMIKGFNDEIRAWLRVKLAQDIRRLEADIAKARGENKTLRRNRAELQSKTRRLENIELVPAFTYSPTGDNRGYQALNHSEVIGMAAAFLQRPPLLDVLVDKYPVLLIDESQDTMEVLLDAFLVAEAQASDRFCLGLIGDTMQSIYGHGKQRLESAIPERWAKPAKIINRRCPKRVVTLINDIRAQVDTHRQDPIEGAPEGAVRMYCVSHDQAKDFQVENEIATLMADLTGDDEWAKGPSNRKTLILEHKMASRRMGFEGVFSPLYAVEHIRTGLLDGTLSVLKLFVEGVIPILNAAAIDSFRLMEAVRLRSPLLDRAYLESLTDQCAAVERVGSATQALLAIFNDADPLICDVVDVLLATNLLPVPERLEAAFRLGITSEPTPESVDRGVLETHAYRQMLESRFSELRAYADYCSELSPYGTHQGVKGLEFPRVMVILSDKEAAGFLWSYDKALGVTPPSASDLQKQADGDDNPLTRTRRLLYVTCSRAQKSLVIVYYSADPEAARKSILKTNWLQAGEVKTFGISDSLPAPDDL